MNTTIEYFSLYPTKNEDVLPPVTFRVTRLRDLSARVEAFRLLYGCWPFVTMSLEAHMPTEGVVTYVDRTVTAISSSERWLKPNVDEIVVADGGVIAFHPHMEFTLHRPHLPTHAR